MTSSSTRETPEVESESLRVDLFGYDVDVDASRLRADTDVVDEQIGEYARGERRAFDVDVRFPDDLTGDVMRAMAQIPYGETRTYGDLAAELDTSPVAVGQACGRNPVPIVVPCHRVVGSDGIGGFSAAGGVDLKRRLLAFERGESLERWG